METADLYRAFAEREARGQSPIYEQLASAVADDMDMLDLLAELPMRKRQPNLFFAANRFLGAPLDAYDSFRRWTLQCAGDVLSVMAQRSTQTNEVGRCASLLPVLAQLPQPLALLEVGAAAGLCLYPDAYAYRYTGTSAAAMGPQDSPVLIECATSGRTPLPRHLPQVVWRAGLDLNPLDVADEDDMTWLEALVWPEHHARRERLRAAATVARADPPHLVKGDLGHDLAGLVAQAPAGATLVVFHSAVLNYVDVETRAAFVELVSALPGHWISNEGLGITPVKAVQAPHMTSGPAKFLLCLDGRPLALTAPHGQQIEWL